ncbi:RNA 2',3'-cyclic phosphodiesterase [bacterium HR35]|nr:RNA 2',3'-cyclic phosphodiesterase [bacterium HR35]
MRLRLFIALPLTSGLKKKVIFLEEKIEKKIGFKLNWIKPENLHLTLLFLGYLSFDDFLKINQIFDNFPWNEERFLKAFQLKIKKIDFGPPGKNSMIWLYLEKDKRLEELKNKFEEILEEMKINYKKEEREFLPHINLCRLKNKKINQEIREELNWGVIFNKIILFESTLKKEGAEYTPHKIIELKEITNL